MSCDKEMAIASGLLPVPNQGATGPSTTYNTVNTLKQKQHIEFMTMLAQLTLQPIESKEGLAERVRPNPNKAKLNKTETRKPITKAVQQSINRRKKKSS